MFTMLESNLGYGASVYASAASCRGAAERDFVHQHVPTLSYSQMLRMSMEESTEDMGNSEECTVLRSNGVTEAYMGSSMCALRSKEDCAWKASNENNHYMEGYNSSRGASMKGILNEGASIVNVCVRQEEGFAENDYGFTCLTLGRGPAPSFDAPSSSSPQNLSRTSSGFTRTCKLCGTSKTPLWRSGPMGAKSLCNACGIRSNKAKKLSAAIVEEEEQGADSWCSKSKGFLKQAASSKVLIKRKQLDARQKKKKKRKRGKAEESDGEFAKQRTVRILEQQQQQQEKLPRLHVNVTSSPVKTESSSCVTSRGTPSPCSTQRRPFPPMGAMVSTQVPQACLNDSMCHFDDCGFPKDEEQAAFLLMALSCGLVLA